MTKLLYIENCYLKEFDATVVDSENNFIVLDQTAFYPTGGGQEHDVGKIVLENGTKINVIDVKKESGIVKHILEAAEKNKIQLSQIVKNTKACGIVDWGRRYKNMRMHTSQHLIAAVVANLFNATCVGNQIHPERSRIDFHPVDFSEDDLRRIENEANNLIKKEIPVTIDFVSREEALKKINKTRVNLDKYPETLKQFRVINIHGVDYDPCGGTHIKNLKEIGKVKIIAKENKGKQKQRIEYVLAD